MSVRRLAWFDLKVLAVVVVLVVLSLTTAGPAARPFSDEELAAFIRETARDWRAHYGVAPDLQVAVVEVRFSGAAADFTEGEGVVIAPAAVELAGAQQILEIATRPERLRRIDVEGIATVAWEYPGRVHRALRYVALALVRRPPASAAAVPPEPAFTALGQDVREEALVRAKDIDEHRLQRCVEFENWARQTAGDGAYTERFLRLARAAGQPPKREEQSDREDICAGMRSGKLTPHQAQVLTTMAAREIGMPAFAFTTASPTRALWVATFVDSLGWVGVDIAHTDRGLVQGGDALLTKTPLLEDFRGASHDFWYADAAAYALGERGGALSLVASTNWGQGSERTTARTVPLEEACR